MKAFLSNCGFPSAGFCMPPQPIARFRSGGCNPILFLLDGILVGVLEFF